MDTGAGRYILPLVLAQWLASRGVSAGTDAAVFPRRIQVMAKTPA
jgi:hypothetical protein